MELVSACFPCVMFHVTQRAVCSCVCATNGLVLQDQVLNEMRRMIKVLQEDCKSLASALTQICTAGAGADISSVLQTLPPNLVNVSLACMHACARWIAWLAQTAHCRQPSGCLRG